MKFRSALLLACMVVVPALAMFSHRIPRGLTAAVRGAVVDPVKACATAAWNRVLGTPESSEPTPPSTPASPAPHVTASPAGPAVAAPEAGPVASALVAARIEAAAVETPPVIVPPVVLSTEPQPEPDVRRALAGLGAVELDCRPLPGQANSHLASCRVPLDAAGQLLRMFHASGATAAEAEARLLAEVTRWRERTAAAQPPAGTPADAAERRIERF